MKLVDKFIFANDIKRKWLAIAITLLISWVFTLWIIYIVGTYGYALFMLLPFFMGVSSTVLYRLNNQITKWEAWKISILTIAIFTASLLVFAIEGFICILMVAPLGLLLAWLGSLIGYLIVKETPSKAAQIMLILICLIPTTAFTEQTTNQPLFSAVTSIEIKAPPQKVWKNVIEFPQLDKPTELIFKTGIAYPINAKIEGSGVGAVRHCNFTTGSFVEPITVWNEPLLLKFNVDEQPAPMRELSFWNVDAPHLHDYFVSKQGQFKLTQLPNGNTLLEGTTWYYHNIQPAFYWQIWSTYIIHSIHERVLTHIKKNSEKP